MLRWFGYIERKKNEDFVKKVFVSETEGHWRREMLVVRRNTCMKELPIKGEGLN